MTGQPNILLVMVEQFSALADPRVADMPVETPALDRLAKQAVRFDRAYCNAPVCGPSRLSFLSGRYACNVEAYDNGSILPSHVPTFAHVLNDAGYRTAMCGRMHIHGLDQHRGFELRLCSEIINPLICTDADWPCDMLPTPPLPPAPDEPFEPPYSDSPIYQHDEYVTQRACEFIGQAHDQPFCLVAGYFAAHTGFVAREQLEPLYRKYMARDLPLPTFTPDDYDRLPQHTRRLLHNQKADQRVYSDAYHQHEMAMYLARIEYVDMQLGRLLDALDAAGRADDTVVIFTADHGENMGRHGIWGKMNFYEEAQRIPLYVRQPGGEARVIDTPVSLVDLLPTLADLGGADVTFPIDGHSLAPLLAGKTQPSRTVFSEYHGYRAPGGLYMTLVNDFKYCHNVNEPDELYDLRTDPQEVDNRIDDPACAAAREACMTELRRIVDVDRMEARIAEHNRQRAAVARSIERSDFLAARTHEQIEAFRAALDEPWWDGGKYMAQYEPQSINTSSQDGGEAKG